MCPLKQQREGLKIGKRYVWGLHHHFAALYFGLRVISPCDVSAPSKDFLLETIYA